MSKKPLKPHLDNALSVTSEFHYGFELHDIVEKMDKNLADELDEHGFAQNHAMLEIIKLGWFHKQAESD